MEDGPKLEAGLSTVPAPAAGALSWLWVCRKPDQRQDLGIKTATDSSDDNQRLRRRGTNGPQRAWRRQVSVSRARTSLCTERGMTVVSPGPLWRSKERLNAAARGWARETPSAPTLLSTSGLPSTMEGGIEAAGV